MKQVLRSFRLFTAQNTLKSVLQVFIIFAVAYLVVGLMGFMSLDVNSEQPESFLAGFLSSFVPGITLMIQMMGVFMLSSMYSYNMPTTPGYKYLHSIGGSADHFKRAIIAANVSGLAMGLLAILINWLINLWIGDILPSPVLSLIICFAGLGVVNLTSFIKGQYGRLIAIMPLGGIVGFVIGFTSEFEDETNVSNDTDVLFVVLAVSVALGIAGFIFSMVNCTKKWREDK